jgi:osmoprotectant transport system ATP-binding protein
VVFTHLTEEAAGVFFVAAAAQAPPMIRVEKLTKRFEQFTAVDQVSFTVQEGETLILLGTSGCGKTTTLKMINRLIEPTAGEIYLQDLNVREQNPEDLRKRIGYVIQNIGLFPHYTVAQNVAVVPRLLRWDDGRIASRSRELLELLGLPPGEFLDRRPDELSGGQKQRVGLARALAADPDVVLLDEPFGALDPITRAQIRKEFVNLESFLHKTMILVTHDVFEACELGDRICLMDAGQIRQIGTAKELIFSPENEYVADFFQANRFQLELMVLTLDDIAGFLPQEEGRGESVAEFTGSATILEVLETAGEIPSRDALLSIRIEDRPARRATAEQIMSAFYQQRSKLMP